MNRTRKTVTLALAALLAVGAIAGATGQVETKTLSFALSGNPDTLDPQKTAGTLTFQTVRSIFDTLVEPDAEGKIVGALAERWEISADNLTWTFYLRKGVKFHNGDTLTAKDVKATFDRIRNKDLASPKASEFASITAVETPDDYTVVMKLAAPSAPLLAALASGWGAILPKSLIDAGHDFANQPVGTGPFVFKEWQRDNRIVLAKNPDYWMKGKPAFDNLIFQIIPERAVQVQALIAGQIDGSDIIDEEDVPALESSGKVNIDRQMTSLILVMAMNCSRKPLDDLRVRQAINYAIDKQQVLNVAYGGGRPIGTFMNYGNAYYKDFTSLYPYDPAKARSLLAQAGVTKDTVLELSLPSNYPPHVKAGEMYQEMLTKVGLNVQIKLVDWPTWIKDVYTAAQYDLTAIGHTGKLDPDGTLGGYGTDKRYVRWVNPTAADLIAKGKVTVGFEARKKLYDQALEIMAKEVPFVYTGTSSRRLVTNKRVKGFRMDPVLDTFDFRYVEIE
jgi:peptide/nickel transport system substrate-binding protein